MVRWCIVVTLTRMYLMKVPHQDAFFLAEREQPAVQVGIAVLFPAADRHTVDIAARAV